jgi:hypothetical protein
MFPVCLADHDRLASFKENLFLKTMDGHPVIDKAYAMIKAA